MDLAKLEASCKDKKINICIVSGSFAAELVWELGGYEELIDEAVSNHRARRDVMTNYNVQDKDIWTELCQSSHKKYLIELTTIIDGESQGVNAYNDTMEAAFASCIHLMKQFYNIEIET